MSARTRQERRAAVPVDRAATRRRVIWFSLAAIAVAAFAAMLAFAPLRSVATRAPSGTEAPAPPGTRQVVVTMAGFAPSTLAVRVSEDLKLEFVNPDSQFHTDGGGWHQFRIDALNIDIRMPPRTRQAVVLGELPVGTYEFYCDVCCGGRENPAMRGVLEVTG